MSARRLATVLSMRVRAGDTWYTCTCSQCDFIAREERLTLVFRTARSFRTRRQSARSASDAVVVLAGTHRIGRSVQLIHEALVPGIRRVLENFLHDVHDPFLPESLIWDVQGPSH